MSDAASGATVTICNDCSSSTSGRCWRHSGSLTTVCGRDAWTELQITIGEVDRLRYENERLREAVQNLLAFHFDTDAWEFVRRHARDALALHGRDDTGRDVRCPRCVEEGAESRVNVGMSFTTLMGFAPYYDEAGEYHSHDPNKHGSNFSCSRGHAWEAKTLRPCPVPSCEYGSDA